MYRQQGADTAAVTRATGQGDPAVVDVAEAQAIDPPSVSRSVARRATDSPLARRRARFDLLDAEP
jgi:hypothetical protein